MIGRKRGPETVRQQTGKIINILAVDADSGDVRSQGEHVQKTRSDLNGFKILDARPHNDEVRIPRLLHVEIA